MSAAYTFLLIESVVFALLGSTNLLFTRWRLAYVLTAEHPPSALDVFWQRDVAVFQVGASVVGFCALVAQASAQRAAFAGLGTVWLLGALLTGQTALFNEALRPIVPRRAGLGISAISLIFAAANALGWVAT